MRLFRPFGRPFSRCLLFASIAMTAHGYAHRHSIACNKLDCVGSTTLLDFVYCDGPRTTTLTVFGIHFAEVAQVQ